MVAKSTDRFIKEVLREAEPSYKLVYVVSLGYLKEYTFNSSTDAMSFARMALTSQDRDSEIEITIKKVYAETEQEETENEEE